jgi:serine kinase of HPr protein (carbohydrate metabolism regulator)
MIPALSSETIHASCVSIAGRGLLIGGRSGAGKSDLALRLLDRGALLVSDDYTLLRRTASGLVASAPETIRGRIEVRGVGIVDWPGATDVTVALFLDLEAEVQRLPSEVPTRRFAGIAIPMLAFDPFPASAPIKAELALRRHGLPAR